MTELARLVVPEELARSEGPRGRMTIELPRAWLAEGATVEALAPKRLVCDRCDGGGCDACGRSGALRLDLPDEARSIRLSFPATSAERIALRLVRPLDADIEQVVVELRAADAPSPGVKRIVLAPPPSSHRTMLVLFGVAMAIAALAAALGR